MESTWSQLGVNLESTWSQHGVNLESTWSQPGVNMNKSNKPKGKILSWIIIITIIIGFFGALVYLQSQKTNKTSEGTQTLKDVKKPKGFADPGLSDEEKAKTDNLALSTALASGKDCDKIQYDSKIKQSCLDTLNYNSAIQKNDDSLCKKISDPTLKTKCLDLVYFNISLQNINTTLCSKISDAKLKQNCMDQIQAILGKSAKSASSCITIKDLTLKQNCLDNYYHSSSIDDLDSKDCDKIKDSNLKSHCTKTIAKNIEVINLTKKQTVTYTTNTDKLKTCDSLSGNSKSTCKDETYYNLAGEKKDLSYCNFIQDSAGKAKCISTQTASINNYYLRQAISKKDSTLCGKILDASLRTVCISNTK